MNAIISILLAILTSCAPAQQPTQQPAEQTQIVRTGELYTFRYSEDADIIVSEIHTDDGNVWQVEDYVAPRGTALIIVFDTNGTQTPKDDQPLQIVAISDFYVDRQCVQ